FKNPLVPIRLLHSFILQLLHGDFCNTIRLQADMHEQAGVSGRYFPVPKSRSSNGDAEIDILVGAGGTLRPLILAPPTWKVHANCRAIPSVSSRLPTTS